MPVDAGRFNAFLIALTPVAVGVVTLLIHWYLPNKQIRIATRAYPLVLQVLLVASAVLVVAQFAWRPLGKWMRQNGPLLAGGFVWLAFWDLMTLKFSMMPLPYFPDPDAVFQGFYDDRFRLLDAAYHSLRLLGTGYTAGVLAGVGSGVLIGWFTHIRYWAMPAIKLAGPIPATALIPLAMVLFANSFFSASALIAWSVWFPVTMLTISGIANVPVSYLDVARTLGAKPGYLIFRVAIPAAMPSIFVGVFMGLLVSFLALCVAETVGVRNGLGYYLKLQQDFSEYRKVWAAILIMAVCFSGLLTILFRVRDWVLVWQKGVIKW